MVKKWIIISLIAIILVVGCVLEYQYVNNTFDYLHDELLQYEKMIKRDEENINTEENIKYITMLHEKWDKKVKWLKALIWHTGIKDIEIGFGRIRTYTEENDYTETLAELQGLIDYLEHYKEEFTFTIENLLKKPLFKRFFFLF